MKWRTGLFFLACLCDAQTQPQALAPNSPVKKSWHTIYRGEKFVPMTGEERAKFLLRRTLLNAGTPARALIFAAIDQNQNDPAGWARGGMHMERESPAAGCELASGTRSSRARRLRWDTSNATFSAIAMAYYAGPAMRFAMNFITYNRDGKWVPNIPRVGSTIATEYIYLSWLPEGARSAHQATRGLGYALATGAAVNIWREFSPPLMRKLKSKIPMMHH